MRFSSLRRGKLLRGTRAGISLALLLLIAGCGSPSRSSTTSHKLPPYSSLPNAYLPALPSSVAGCTTKVSASGDMHVWVPDEVIIGLAFPPDAFNLNTYYANQGLQSAVAQQVGTAINQLLPSDRGLSITESHVDVWGGGLGALHSRLVSPPDSQGKPQDCLQHAIDGLNYRVNQSGGIAFTIDPQTMDIPVEITGASPDWYTIATASDSTPCCGNGIGGSPGGHPHPASATPTPTSSTASATPTPTSSTAGGGETVYVLDTADPLNAPLSVPDPDLVPGLCPSDPTTKTVDKTTVCYTELKDLSKVTHETDSTVKYANTYLPEYDPTGTNTDIREHGMFISDLIHHVAPSATINLLRTLNDHGAGDILDLMGSLRYVLAHGPSAIVNMSLTTVLSPGCLLDVWHNWQSKYFSLAQGGTLACGNPAALTGLDQPYFMLMFTPLGQLIQALQDKGDLLVAAAGAHAAGAVDVYAGMPAAFCGVRAVAAAPSKVATQWQVPLTYSATYIAPTLATFSSGSVSNLPYLSGGACSQVPSASNVINALQNGTAAQPQMPQIGKKGPNDAVAALGVGVCSIYPQNTSSIPAAPPAGWATWDGTSFATALISGNLAANKDSLPSTLDESQPCQVQ